MSKQYLKKFLYDPVIARLIYDLFIAYAILVVTALLFFGFGVQTLSYYQILLFPPVLIFFNFLIGLYGRYRLASVRFKGLVLFTASLLTLFVFDRISTMTLPLVLSTFFIFLATYIPRIFLNFHKTAIDNPNVISLINDSSPILIVGGGGYIGTHVVEKLLQQNYKVRVFDKFLYSRSVFSDLEPNRNLEIIEGDVTDLYSLTLALKDVQAVVHLAGIVGDPAAKLDEKLTRHVNIVSTRMLKESVKAFRIPKFIFASSCSVYGSSPHIVNENSPLNPVSLYAQTKIDSELELLQDTFDAFHPTILRFATVYGHSRKPRFDLVANLFVAQAFNNGIITVMNGKQWRPFIHVSDTAESIVQVIKAPVDKVSRQIFNVGDDAQLLQIGQLARKVSKIVSADHKVKVVTQDIPGDKRNYRVSFKKIHDTLGFAAHVGIDEGIQEVYENFKTNNYKLPLNDPFYSNLEMTKIIKKEFYSKNYRKTHFSEIS